MRIEGYVRGDRLWSAWCAFSGTFPAEAARPRVWIREVEVLVPEAGVVRCVSTGQAEVLRDWERLFTSQQEAREAMAADLERVAAGLTAQAAELAEPRIAVIA